MREINMLCVSSEPDSMERVCPKILEMLELGPEECAVVPYYSGDVPSAEKLLFERTFSLLVIDDSLDGAFDFVKALKGDELFKFLPALVVQKKKEKSERKLAFSSGADDYVPGPFSPDELVLHALPLLRNKLLMDDLIAKIMRLQDENIKNYILTDLIKRYIPKTVWDTANRFADEQNIFIPETEEEVTIVYGDIAGFTKTSQHKKPKEVIDMLNDAYSTVNSLTYAHGGDIDKFIGDAFLAVFKAPKEAIECAVKIQQEFFHLNARRADEGKTTFRFRIGVHTGTVIRGNVGSELRSDNTLIGDTVNTAARIESVTPPGEVFASREACLKAGLEVPAGYMVQESVKGIDRPLVMFNVYRCFQERT